MYLIVHSVERYGVDVNTKLHKSMTKVICNIYNMTSRQFLPRDLCNMLLLLYDN